MPKMIISVEKVGSVYNAEIKNDPETKVIPYTFDTLEKCENFLKNTPSIIAVEFPEFNAD